MIYISVVILLLSVYNVKVGSEDAIVKDCTVSHLNSSDCKDATAEDECRDDKYRCSNGECIDMARLCDGQPDCSDQSDESEYCVDRQCNPYQFKCASGKCIPSYFVCNGREDCRDGSDERTEGELDWAETAVPNVTIMMDSKVLYGNSTYQYMDYEDSIRLKFICEASYPVEWIFNFENVAGSAEFNRGNILESVWNGTASYFRNVLNLSFESIFGENVFYCRALQHSCTQSMVVSYYGTDSDHVRFEIKDKADKKIDSIFSTKYGDSQSDCHVIWYYEQVENYRIWSCIQPKTGEPGLVSILPCENANLCNNFFRNNRQPKHCIRESTSKKCKDCAKKTDYSSQGRIIECFHEDDMLGSSYTSEIFNGLSIGDNWIPKMYLDIADAPMEELLLLEEFPHDVYYIGENITIACGASAYYFQPNIDIALQFKNETVQILHPGEESREYLERENEHVTRYQFQAMSEDLDRVYCIGSSLRTLELTNTTRSIEIQVPIGPMLLVLGEADTIQYVNGYSNDGNSHWGHERIEWEDGDEGKSITCNVSGKPIPIIVWTKNGNRILPTFEDQSDNWLFSQVTFTTVDESTGGLYICEAVNIANNESKIFEVIVKANDLVIAVAGGVLGAAAIIAVVSIVGLRLFKKRGKKGKSMGRQTTKL